MENPQNKPDQASIDHQRRWANTNRDYIEGVRSGKYAVPEGETMKFHIKKYLLASVVGDDLQTFAFSPNYFILEETWLHKETALTRLDFEIEQPELPADVKLELEEVRGVIDTADVSTKKGYFETRRKYSETINKVRKIVSKDKSLGMTFLT